MVAGNPKGNSNLILLLQKRLAGQLCCQITRGADFIVLISQKLLLLQGQGNRPRSIYQYSNMAPRLSGQTSIFGVAFLYPSLFWELRDKRNKKFTVLTRKPWIHVRILIYRTWAIVSLFVLLSSIESFMLDLTKVAT